MNHLTPGESPDEARTFTAPSPAEAEQAIRTAAEDMTYDHLLDPNYPWPEGNGIVPGATTEGPKPGHYAHETDRQLALQRAETANMAAAKANILGPDDQFRTAPAAVREKILRSGQ